MFQNIELNAAHHFHFLVETLWSPKTMSLIKFPKVWVSMTAIIFCIGILWKACVTWHFWATNRKLIFSWKITPLGAIPPLKIWQLSVFSVISIGVLVSFNGWNKGKLIALILLVLFHFKTNFPISYTDGYILFSIELLFYKRIEA